jgi:hypothetical protein
MRLVGLFVEMTGLHRVVGASLGTPQRLTTRVEAARVAYPREATPGLTRGLLPKEITGTPEATCTGG